MSGQILALGSTLCILQRSSGSWPAPESFLQGDTGSKPFSICSSHFMFLMSFSLLLRVSLMINKQ